MLNGIIKRRGSDFAPKTKRPCLGLLLSSIVLLLSSLNTFAQPINLGVSQNFALFTSNGAMTNSGTSNITGNVGAHIGAVSGFGLPTIVNGTLESANALTAQCAIDVQAAYNQIFIIPGTIPHAPAFGAGETVLAGVYSIAGAGSLGGNITLDGQGDPNAVFIFKFSGAFNTGAASNVIMINGTQSCNVFWAASGAIAMAATTQMKGTVIGSPGAVSMAAGGTLEGRMLTTNGAVFVDQVLIIAPCISSDTTLPHIDVECYGDVPAPDPLILTGVYTCNALPPTVVFISDVSNGFTCPDTITRTYSVTDDCGDETLVTQTIAVNDITNPTASNGPLVVVECIGDLPLPDISVINDEADNCAIIPVVAFVSDVSDGLTCPQTITRTYSITDNCDNQTLVTQTFTVNDITNPTASNIPLITVECIGDVPLPDITVVNDEADNCTAFPLVAFVSDVSDGLTCSETIIRTYSVTDDCGNQILVTQTIIVNDITNPTASNPATTTIPGGPAPAVDPLVVIDEADNCTVPVVAFVSESTDGATCPETITRIYSVTDACGNTINVSHLILITDPFLPTASNPLAANVECIGDVPAPNILVVTDEADNQGPPVVAFVSDVSDGFTCPETITRTYSVTDICGGQILVTQIITVNDVTDPTASNIPPLGVECNGDVPLPNIILVNDEADNCSVLPVVAFVSDLSDGLTCPETITRTYSVTDNCGNQILVTQAITVNDITNPTASNIPLVSVECAGDVPLTDVTIVNDEADNCTLAPIVAFVSDVSDGLTCSETIIRTYSVTDNCGNQILVTQTIIVNDITNPTASDPATTTLPGGPLPATDPLVVIDEADNCAVPVVAFVSESTDGGTCPETITRIYSVTDACGNTINVIHTILITDPSPPTASNPIAVNVECIGDVPVPNILVVTDEADNQGPPLVAFVSDISDGLSCPETITRTYSVTDICGNQILVAQTISVNDITNPTASNIPLTNVECFSDAPIDITLINDEADNCTAVPLVAFVSDVSNGLTCPETITRTYSVTDNCGNQVLVTQTILINDITNPTASNPLATSVPIISMAPINPAVVTDEADNCTVNPAVTWLSDVSDGNVCNNELITRTYVVTDNCGNQTFVTHLITLTAIYPTINAGIDQVGCENILITVNAAFAPSTTVINWSSFVVNGVPFNSPVNTTSYTVSGDNYGCIATDDLSITINPMLFVNSDVNMGCEPLDVTFTNTTVSAFPFTSCVWDLGTGEIINECGSITYTYEDAGLYDVSLTTTYANGCSNTINAIDYIYVQPNPVARFTASEYTLNNLVAAAEVEFENLSTGAVDYFWDFDDGGTSMDQDPSHFFSTTNEGSYEVTLIAYSDLGCTDTVYQVIQVEEELIYYIPNTFTPDGDQLNNSFQPIFTSGFDPFDYTLYIYNRWGNLLFVSHNSGIGWDGSYNGQLAQDGTYVWKVEFKSNINAEKFSEIGHVNLLR
jgi:gliding motility-associated-like protein